MTQTNLVNLSYLIVDDELRSRKILKTLLEKGIGANDVMTLGQPEKFSSILRTLNPVPDVVFLDLMMEPLSGFDLLVILRQLPRYSQTIAVAVTARAMPHDIELMQSAGFDGLISKPIVRQVFGELLGRIVSGEKLWYIA